MREIYKEKTDEELIQALRDGDREVTDFLMNKYKNLVRSKAGRMYILGADREDLIQEGMIGLLKAIRDYDCGRDASFFTFAELCISRQIYSAVEAADRKKHSPLNNYVSIYSGEEESSNQSGNENIKSPLVNSLVDETNLSPEELLIDKEELRNLEQYMAKELSPLEKQVMELTLVGMGYVEIAKVLGRDEKSTDNALQRARNKMKKYKA